MRAILFVGIGSFIGGVARYLLTRLISNGFGAAFPYGTLFVNLLGCYLIGLFYGFGTRNHLLDIEWRLFLTVGICGGFTTFSSFAMENLTLLRENNLTSFCLYTGISVFSGLFATWLGDASVRLL